MRFLDLFRKMKTTHTFGWKDVTFGQFNRILEISKDEQPSKELRIKHLLFGDGDGNLSFLNEEIPVVDYRSHYWLNGREYRLIARYDRMTTSQFVDFTTCAQDDKLSAVLVPVHHKYNDGYDIDLVKADIRAMKMPDYIAVVNFLVRQSQALLMFFQEYSEEMTKKMGLTTTQLKKITSLLTDYSLELSEYVRLQMKNTRIC